MTQAEVTDTPIALYRLFAADGTLLYLGITSNPGARFSVHAKSKQWWPLVTRRTVEWHESRGQAERAEMAAVLAENPLHNIFRGRLPDEALRKPKGGHRRQPLSVRLPEDLERRLVQAAADAGVPVNAVICRAVADHLDAREKQEITR